MRRSPDVRPGFAIPPGERLGNHHDTAEESQYILSGSGDLLTDQGAQPINPGDVFVLTEGTSHDLQNTGGEDLRVLAFFSKPQVEQHWDIETWPPDDTKVTGSRTAADGPGSSSSRRLGLLLHSLESCRQRGVDAVPLACGDEFSLPHRSRSERSIAGDRPQAERSFKWIGPSKLLSSR
jgi:hypothetical protein